MARACWHCGDQVGGEHRFCPWCGSPQRRKLVEFFAADPRFTEDRLKALRVSRYVDEGHVRFSIWSQDRASDALSLDEDEARRLAAFLIASCRGRSTLARFGDGVESLADRLARALKY